MNLKQKQIILVLALALIVGAIWYLEAQKPMRSAANPESIDLMTDTHRVAGKRGLSIEEKEKQYPRAKELADIQGYINSEKFKLADLVGKKVILIDFWTYSCINCQRTTPYLNMWYEKYKDKGFVIVGVHAPEFEFEKNYDNVSKAVKEMNIKYPVVLDNNHGTWDAYQNRYWPHELLIDIDGFVVHDHIGEGGYDESEAEIQKLLKERADVLKTDVTINEKITSPSADDIEAGSPETYFGADRNSYFENGTPGETGEQMLGEPVTIETNKLYLIGKWNIMPEYAETPETVGSPQAGSDRIDYRYRAKRVYFVAGNPTKPTDVEVLMDSAPIPASARGADIFYKNGKSYVKIQDHKLYKIIEDKTFSEHLLEFIVPSAGLQAFTFTFG